jgi:hypothetical protein
VRFCENEVGTANARRTTYDRDLRVVAAGVDYRLFRSGMFNNLTDGRARIRSQAEMRQGHGDFGRPQPRGVVGVDVRKHYDPVAIDDVCGRQRQHPTVGTLFQPFRIAERKIGGLELPSHYEGDAITGSDPSSRIFEDQE